MSRVMIVDDEPEVRSVLHGFVTVYFEQLKQPCEIEALDDPMEALFRLSDAKIHYDAILLDVRMPTMGGDDIYQAIDAMGGGVAARVMFITGYAKDLLDRYHDRNLLVLAKPFTFARFSSALAGLLQGK
ncbi:MAG: response regulator [Mariprofundales bacterium]|nr:response regulator [Mariprofundales bacterium]